MGDLSRLGDGESLDQDFINQIIDSVNKLSDVVAADQAALIWKGQHDAFSEIAKFRIVGGNSVPTVEVGPAYSGGTARADLNTSPPAGAALWAYCGTLRSIWTSLASNVSGITQDDNSVIGEYVWPGSGAYSGSAFATAFTGTPPAGPNLTWTTIGALGPAGSQSFAIGFTAAT
jgi:hypothetical protein